MYIFAAVYFSFATQVSELSQFIKSWASLFTTRCLLITGTVQKLIFYILVWAF